MKTLRSICLAALAGWAVSLPGVAEAQITVFSMDLPGFNLAAGTPPIAVNFDGITPGTNINGSHHAGATLSPTGAPLIVVRAVDTFTPAGVFSGTVDESTNKLPATSGLNVLSPGGAELGLGTGVDNDGLELVFDNPIASFGLDHLSQSGDGFSYTIATVYDTGNNVIYSGTVPIVGGSLAGPGTAEFWGIVSTSANIKRITFEESDGDSAYPDANIGFDSLRYFDASGGSVVPEPGGVVLLPAAAIALLIRRRRRGE